MRMKSDTMHPKFELSDRVVEVEAVGCRRAEQVGHVAC